MGGNKSKPIVEAAARTLNNQGKTVMSQYAQASKTMPEMTVNEAVAASIQQQTASPSLTPAVDPHQSQANLPSAPEPEPEPGPGPGLLKQNNPMTTASTYDPNRKLTPEMIKFIHKTFVFESKELVDPAEIDRLFKSTALYVRLEEQKLYELKNGAPTLAGKLNNSQLIDFMEQYAKDPTDATLKRLSDEYQIEVATARMLVRWTRMPLFIKDEEGDTYAY